MVAQKKLMIKGQIVTQLAGRLNISKKAATSKFRRIRSTGNRRNKEKGSFCAPRHWQISPRQKKG